ncbi:hypothetical protein IEO21_00685 [Rhodonia placenta]|uniref:Selenoprotein W n=1 Tax=Rhodonia placenta TaxID=104341 RepID=A0A8H7PBD0_9APHY|nr:hypothetical protein IEO21_00685 [Postia placenta]
MAEGATCEDCVSKPNVEGQTLQSEIPSTKPQDLLDASTFVPPSPLPSPSVTIEFCDRFIRVHRATWVSTELFLTFPTPALKAISILPLNSEETGGRFRVWLFLGGQPPVLVWDRKIEGSFPELKVLKQRIRDHIQPGKSLGHSDHK